MALLRQGGYWDAAHDGLMNADHLSLDLKGVKSAYNNICSDYHMIKVPSPRELNLLALLNLRHKGSCVLTISKTQF